MLSSSGQESLEPPVRSFSHRKDSRWPLSSEEALQAAPVAQGKEISSSRTKSQELNSHSLSRAARCGNDWLPSFLTTLNSRKKVESSLLKQMSISMR